MTVTSVAVATTKFLFGMCDCTVDSDTQTGEFSLMLGILHVCRTRACTIARVSGHGMLYHDAIGTEYVYYLIGIPIAECYVGVQVHP